MSNHLANRHKGKTLKFYTNGYIVTHRQNPQELTSSLLSSLISSYHLNTLGEFSGHLPFIPSLLEEKPAYKLRVAQSIIDIVIAHAMAMRSSGQSHKVLFMVTHHNAVFEFMRLFGRKEEVGKKPNYCWTGAIDLKVDLKALGAFVEERA